MHGQYHQTFPSRFSGEVFGVFLAVVCFAHVDGGVVPFETGDRRLIVVIRVLALKDALEPLLETSAARIDELILRCRLFVLISELNKFENRATD
jgi:hypothetical protein